MEVGVFFLQVPLGPNNKRSREKSPLFSSAFAVSTEACEAGEDAEMGS